MQAVSRDHDDQLSDLRRDRKTQVRPPVRPEPCPRSPAGGSTRRTDREPAEISTVGRELAQQVMGSLPRVPTVGRRPRQAEPEHGVQTGLGRHAGEVRDHPGVGSGRREHRVPADASDTQLADPGDPLLDSPAAVHEELTGCRLVPRIDVGDHRHLRTRVCPGPGDGPAPRTHAARRGARRAGPPCLARPRTALPQAPGGTPGRPRGRRHVPAPRWGAPAPTSAAPASIRPPGCQLREHGPSPGAATAAGLDEG